MKVICIEGVNVGDASLNPEGSPARKENEIYEGEIYNVEKVIEIFNIKTYKLIERPKAIYDIRHFIPLSDVDELNYSKQMTKTK